MSCRAPQVYLQPYIGPTTSAPSNQTDRYGIIVVNADEPIAAVELDCSSEIDCAIVQANGGRHFIAIGSPAIGPFESPVQIQPWRRVMPWGPDVQTFTGEPLLTTPPLLGVKIHYYLPPSFQQKRAPVDRAAPDGTTGAAYSVMAEFPLYGFRNSALTVLAVGNSLTYKVEGVKYRARVTTSEQQGDPVNTRSSPTLTQLVLDSTGAVERTVASGATESLTLTDEPFDTLLVSAKNGTGSATCKLSFRAEGEN